MSCMHGRSDESYSGQVSRYRDQFATTELGSRKLFDSSVVSLVRVASQQSIWFSDGNVHEIVAGRFDFS